MPGYNPGGTSSGDRDSAGRDGGGYGPGGGGRGRGRTERNPHAWGGTRSPGDVNKGKGPSGAAKSLGNPNMSRNRRPDPKSPRTERNPHAWGGTDPVTDDEIDELEDRGIGGFLRDLIGIDTQYDPNAKPGNKVDWSFDPFDSPALDIGIGLLAGPAVGMAWGIGKNLAKGKPVGAFIEGVTGLAGISGSRAAGLAATALDLGVSGYEFATDETIDDALGTSGSIGSGRKGSPSPSRENEGGLRSTALASRVSLPGATAPAPRSSGRPADLSPFAAYGTLDSKALGDMGTLTTRRRSASRVR